MEMHIIFQLANICFYSLFFVHFFLQKQMPTRANRIYKAMMLVGAANLLLDAATVFSLVFFENMPLWFVNGSHRVFIITLDLYVVLLCLYVISLIGASLRLTIQKSLLLGLPFVISIFTALLGNIYYYKNGMELYSYGLAVSTVYVSVAIYLLIALILAARYKNRIGKMTRIAVIFSVSMETVFGIIQLFNPAYLLSGLGITLMQAFLLLSMVNPGEYIDKETNTLNRYAFFTMIQEYLDWSRTFYVVNIIVDNWTYLYSQQGMQFMEKLIKAVAAELGENGKIQVYHSRTRCLSILLRGKKKNIEEWVEQILEKTRQEWTIDGISIKMNNRIVVIEAPKYLENKESIIEIMEMFVNKKITEENTTNRIIFYTEKHQAVFQRNKAIEILLRDAVREDGFLVYYQPIYSRKDNGYHSAEALVRLKDSSTLGYISPEEFIAIAEKIGLIKKIGRIVFQKVCQFAKKEKLMERGISFIEINLSVIECMNPALSQELDAIMKEYDIPPSFINLEITERVTAEGEETVRDNIWKLRQIGCSFSMDDYGTGYSNIAPMIELGYDIIKIDKSLIWPYFQGKGDKYRILLASTVKMFHKLGVKVVAEGVETKEQADTLIEMEVDYLQGFYYTRPLPEEDFCNLLHKI